MTEEDEEFNRIEREAAMRKEAVAATVTAYQKGYADAMGWKTENYLEHLPLREWIELTDDEVVHLKMAGRDLEFVSMTALRRFAKDIEAKLKEKNGM
jgi:hypothetical protein